MNSTKKRNLRNKDVFGFALGLPNGLRYLRVAGVDNAWEQEKPEARKMLENAAESHTSGARFVSRD
jgi:hypothetical protein